jgi:hypothetical protein
VYVLDQATGTPVFQLSTPGPLDAQPTFAAGKLFISDASGVLYALSPPSVTPPPPPSGSGSSFTDDFSRTTGLGASWLTWFGSYSTNGSSAVSGPAPVQGNWASVVPSIGTNDYSVTATLSIPPGALYSGVVARGNPGNFTSDLYTAQVSTDGTVNLYRRNQWTWTRLGSAAAGITSGPSYTLQLVVTGSSPVHLEVWLGGTKMISVDDSSGARITSGVPGIECYDAGVRFDQFQVSTGTGTPPPATAATPVFTPAAGTYPTSQSVTISDATSGATIYYTVDGTTPTTGSTPYTGPIPIATTATVQAIAAGSGLTTSAVASATYTIQPPVPPPPGSQSLFSDDFTRTTGLGASWLTWFGSYSTNGSSAVSGPAPIQGNWASVVPPLGTNDYAVTATLSIPPGALYSGIVARGTPSSFTSDLYTAQVSTDGTVNLYRRNQWTWTRLGSAAAGITSGPSYTLQLVVTGSSPVHLEVWLGGTKMISVDDSSGARITSGVPGIECYDAGVRYDHFEVSSGTGPVTPPPATAATPVFTPAAGTYPTPQSVTISEATPGATIYYTVDGTPPTTGSTPYTGPIAIATTTTVQAIAAGSGLTTSAVASATYTIQPSGSASLFADDFARTTGLGASWLTWFGGYSTNGSSAVSGPAPVQGNWASVVPSIGTNDYSVTATLSIPPRALYSGIVARGNPSNFTSDLYTAQVSTDGTVNLYRRNQWTWTRLGSVAAGIKSGPSYTLQLVVTGSSPVHLEVWLGGTKMISVDDSSGARVTSGIPGIECYDAGVRFDQFDVSGR